MSFAVQREIIERSNKSASTPQLFVLHAQISTSVDVEKMVSLVLKLFSMLYSIGEFVGLCI